MATGRLKDVIGAGLQYPYSPVYSTPQQPAFRLLVIFSGLPDDPLTGILVDQVLDLTGQSEPFWTAVSYAWKGQKASEILNVDDQYLPITSNVAQIIRDLRKPDQHITLWIDAICINQEDEDEKRSQIPIMQEIYGKAKEVVVWLSPSAGVSPADLTLISRWLDEKGGDRERDMPAVALDVAFRQDHPGFEWYSPFHRLAKCEWFQRIWVIQEVVVAQHVYFHILEERFTWDFICSATLRFLSGFQMKPALQQTLDQCCVGGLRKDYGTETHQAIAMLRLVHRLRTGWPNHTNNLAPSEVVHLCRHQLATKPADMIYGVSGLFAHYHRPAGGELLEIDYRRSSFQVYQNFAIWCMETENNLDVIAQLRNEGGASPWRNWNQRRQDSLEKDPSSWVGLWYEGSRINFTTSPDIDLDPMRERAVTPIPSEICMFRQLGNTLSLRGFIIDTFVDGTRIRDQEADHAAWLKHIPRDPKANLVLFGVEKPTAKTLKKKMTRTLGREPVCSHLWRDGKLPTPKRQGISGDWRVPFLTNRGCLAITYPYMPVKDKPIICALYGARALFVLTPKKQQSGRRVLYTLVSGDCFIDGFEDGKGIEMARKLGLKEQDIFIA